MSDLHVEPFGLNRLARDSDRPRPKRLPWHLRAIITSSRILFWGAIQFVLCMAEQVAELLAPMLFVTGIVWWAIVHVVASLKIEDATLQKLAEHIPATLSLAGHALTPAGLIWDGLLLMALVAGCRTVGDIIAKET